MSPQPESRGRGRPSRQCDITSVDCETLAQDLSTFARQVQDEKDPEAVLEKIVRAAVDLIPGTDEASISVVTGRRDITSRHPTGDLPHQVDDLQMQTGEGPCLDAAYEHETVRVDEMATEVRWPDFAGRAAQVGAKSMLSFQLFVERDNLGALNLYSRTPRSFDEESEYVGLLFASHAAIALADAEQVRHLNVALDRRDLIGQAKGILMERYKVTADQAFRVLVRASQNHNVKLHDVAHELTATGLVADLVERASSDASDPPDPPVDPTTPLNSA